MTKVNFYDNIDDSMLKFAVIIARHNGKWVFCKHKERNTWQVQGGHREANEDIIDTAKRELFEETGAIDFDNIEVNNLSDILNFCHCSGQKYAESHIS